MGSLNVKLSLVEGYFQGFANLPHQLDAIYYYSPNKAHVIIFDQRLIGYEDAQGLLREHLKSKIAQKLRDCGGMIRKIDFEWYTSLEALGVMLKPRPALPSPAARRVELPWVQMQPGQGQGQQQPDKENPQFGTLRSDTTPSWFPTRTNAFK
jgi:hypothetical protein